MSVVAIARVKDEADVIAATVTRMREEVDHVIVEDNASTDGTVEILHTLDVEVLHDATVGYYQSRMMSRLAAYAAQERGAAWVIPFDADERWMSPFGRIRDVLTEHPQASIATAVLYDHVATGIDPQDIEDPVARLGWRRRDPAPLRKVAVRPYPRVTIHQGNHGADYGDTVDGLLVVRHFSHRSAAQLITKVRNGAAAYAQTTLPPEVGAHWRQWGSILDERGEEAIVELFRTWYWRLDPTAELTINGESQPPLIFDPCP